MADLFRELREKAQTRIADQLFAAARQTDSQLREIGGKIAAECRCLALYGPLKDRGRAEEKVRNDYQGDWYDLKDVARMTIVATNDQVLSKVKLLIRSRCVASMGMGIVKDDDSISKLGYSGVNFVVRLKNGRFGEIQANTPNILYCKMSESSFRKLLGYDAFLNIKGKYGVRGGVGHGLYEIFRSNEGSPAANHAVELSCRYYKYFRGFPNWSVGKALDGELAAVIQANPHIFLKH